MPHSISRLLLEAITHHQQGRGAEAKEIYLKIIALDQNNAAALNNLALIIGGDDGIDLLSRALALKPDYLDASNNLHVALHRAGLSLAVQGMYEKAAPYLLRALSLKPDHKETRRNALSVVTHLGLAALAKGSNKDASGWLDQLLKVAPDIVEANVLHCILTLPRIFSDEAQVETQRKAYSQSLIALRQAYDRTPGADWENAIGVALPFYLPYQGEDDRELQSIYGNLVCRIMADRYPPANLAGPPTDGEPIRIGIVSDFFRQHSNWKIPIKGWVSQIDKNKFRLFGYHTSHDHDCETSIAASFFERFVQGPLSIPDWRTEIATDRPHILIYPEIGIAAMPLKLAGLRLAPIQCTSWGQPVTSGMPTIDYYLSSDLMEVNDSDKYYTEQLIRLPNLSIYYQPQPQPSLPLPLTRDQFCLNSKNVVYWCGQNLSKFLPKYDSVFPRIAQHVQASRFIFHEPPFGKDYTEIFQSRLCKAFNNFGLNSDDHCIILPTVPFEIFSSIQKLCDVILDSIDWSGCNTTLESLLHDIPIVTAPGAFMRGRHTSAILNMMGVTETIASGIDGYVEISTKLGLDPAWRQFIRTKMALNVHKVYSDKSCISGLESFFVSATKAL